MLDSSRARRLIACLLCLGAALGCEDPAPASDAGPPLPLDSGRPDAGPPQTCDDLTLPGVSIEPIVPGHGWNSPIFLTQAPGDDALYVVEQPGRIMRVVGTDVSVFLDIRDRVNGNGERGLLGLAFHPGYADNGRFFVFYTPTSPDTNRVAEFARNAVDPAVADDTDVAVLVDIDDPESNHNGGMIAFGPDGFLYVGTGDGGGGGDQHGPTGNGLDTDTLLGKLLRLDVDAAGAGYAAAGNPFVGGGGLPQIWAYGLRNPWRFSFDRQTGDLYIGDVGQGEYEEIDFAPASSTGGENYGWRAYEGNEVFNASNLDLVPDHAAPVHVYPHGGDGIFGGCSITGGYVYRGAAIPALQGWYLFADYCNDRRAAIRVCDGEARGYQQVPGLSGPPNISSFGEDRAGELYMTGSNVWRIVAE